MRTFNHELIEQQIKTNQKILILILENIQLTF